MTLRFTRCAEYDREWDVWEGTNWSGFLRFDVAVKQWIFRSSDDSIVWKLGRKLRAATSRLRARYRAAS